MVISRTPYRISFFGGGTDYPAWYRVHGGQVLSATIDKYSYLTCRYLPPFFEHRFRVVYSHIENVRSVDEIVHPAARTVLRYMKMDRGVEVHHDGDLPARSGMGSSSSYTVGLLHSLYALRGQMASKQQLAMESIHIEQDLLRETVGSQDQVSAAYGGLNHIRFHPNGEVEVHPVVISHDRARDLADHLMLFYTGIKRTASDVAGSYVQDIEKHEAALKAISAMVPRGIEVLTGGGDLRPFGELLDEAWQIKRQLSGRVSNPSVETIYEAARGAGAIGGKLLGAGGGGFMLLVVPPDRREAVQKKLHRFLYVPFKLEFSGSQVIFFAPEPDYANVEQTRLHEDDLLLEELARS